MKSLAKIADKDFVFTPEYIEKKSEVKGLLLSILKLHQVLSLVDIDFEPILPLSKFNVRLQNLPIHFSELLEEFKQFDGINYMAGDGSQDSKLLSHATEAKALLDIMIEDRACKRQFDKSNVQITGDLKGDVQ